MPRSVGVAFGAATPAAARLRLEALGGADGSRRWHVYDDGAAEYAGADTPADQLAVAMTAAAAGRP